VQEYESLSDNLDRGKFNNKVKRLTFELGSEQKEYLRSTEAMNLEKQKLQIYLQGAKRDLQEETQRYEMLLKQLSDQD